MRLVWCILLLTAVAAAQPRTESGELNGAQFRIDVPANWNGGLIMYCHGYSPVPGNFDHARPNPLLSLFLDQGFAVAQSGYASGGWAIEEAVLDTQALRRYFVRKYGAPKETYATGHSMGGFLTMTLLESFPNDYDGGLPLCGPLAPADWFMARRVFDMRVVFDYYFPDALPAPDRVPADFSISSALNERIADLLDGKPLQAEAVRRWSGIHTNKELAATLVFFTYILKDLQQRGGGNPFDNQEVIYEGTLDDNTLNDGLKRYSADRAAAEYLAKYYTPSGRLARPMLAVHTTYDPLVPPWTPNMYTTLTTQSGSADRFVQQYVKHDGHCAIQPAEIGRAFTELREWVKSGTRPRGGALR